MCKFVENLKLYVLCVFLSVAFFACNGGDENKPEETPVFEVRASDKTQNFAAAADFKFVTVKTNRQFTATPSETWCTATILDEETDNLKISVTANTGSETRTAEVVLACQGFDNITVTVNQAGVPVIVPELSVKETKISLEDDELEFSLEITTNIEIVFELPTWIKEKTGNPNGKIWSFAADKLASGERSGDIVVKSKDAALSKKVTIPVSQKIIPVFGKIGAWLFNDPNDLTKATIGKALSFTPENGGPLESLNDGPNGKKAIRIKHNSYFLCDMLTPKAGENYISEYSVLIVFRVPTFDIATVTNPTNTLIYYPLLKAKTLHSAESSSTAADAEVLIRANADKATGAMGIGATGYGGVVNTGQWYRVYLTYGPNSQRYFLNNAQIINATSNDARFLVSTSGLLFFQHNLNKKEYSYFDVAEIGLWNYQLTAAEIQELEK